jgi:two-component system sensor histidine kinase/response regulator
MTQIAGAALQELKNSLLSVTAKITVHPLLPVRADENLIRQVFLNLLSNAIKYSGLTPNPEIEINSYYEETEVVYCIKDNGVGFDMKYSDKLFGVFERLHKGAEFEGTGVGLALVKRIIARHGGRVWANAEVGKGATFYFSLHKSM